jgi:hypothetical protein
MVLGDVGSTWQFTLCFKYEADNPMDDLMLDSMGGEMPGANPPPISRR